jgi:hypothetical protein
VSVGCCAQLKRRTLTTSSQQPDDDAILVEDVTSRGSYSASQNHIMPECQKCGAFVSDLYIHVFARPVLRDGCICSQCEDALWNSVEILPEV